MSRSLRRKLCTCPKQVYGSGSKIPDIIPEPYKVPIHIPSDYLKPIPQKMHCGHCGELLVSTCSACGGDGKGTCLFCRGATSDKCSACNGSGEVRREYHQCSSVLPSEIKLPEHQIFCICGQQKSGSKFPDIVVDKFLNHPSKKFVVKHAKIDSIKLPLDRFCSFCGTQFVTTCSRCAGKGFLYCETCGYRKREPCSGCGGNKEVRIQNPIHKLFCPLYQKDSNVAGRWWM